MSEVTSPDAPRPVYQATPYTLPPGRFGFGTVPVFVAGLIAAVLVGTLASWVGQFFYLVVLYPVAIGILVGVSMIVVARLSKMRSQAAAIVLGLICGAGAMAAMHYADYRRAVQDLPPGMDVSFGTYIDDQAEAGVVVGKRGKGFNLGYTGTYIYWLVEVGIVAAITAFLVYFQTRLPFCADCNAWMKEDEIGPFSAAADVAQEWVTSGQIARLTDTGVDRATLPENAQRIEAFVFHCPHCHPAGPVVVQLMQVTGAPSSKTGVQLCEAAYPGEALAVIRATAPAAG